MSSDSNILIVGGGIGGLVLASRLARNTVLKQRARVTLVDGNASHAWKPMLHTFAAGTTHAYQHKVPYVAHAKRHGFQYVPGALQAIDRETKKIEISPIIGPDGKIVLEARRKEYELLVLATGSTANDFGIPGVAQHCHFIDSLGSADTFRIRLKFDLIRAAERDLPLKIAIVGGGATGVELAAEVSQVVEFAEAYGTKDLRNRVHLVLIDAGSRLLEPFPEEVSNRAQAMLRKLGVEIRLNTTVLSVNDRQLDLSDGSSIDSSLKVWAAGIKSGDSISVNPELETTRTGQTVVNDALQATNDASIFAIGDCSSYKPVGAERPLPATAQVARQQAVFLSKQLPRVLDGMSPGAFSYRDLGSVVSLGNYNAYGSLGKDGLFRDAFFAGRLAQWTHSMLYRMHQADLHGFLPSAGLWLSDSVSRLVRPNMRLD